MGGKNKKQKKKGSARGPNLQSQNTLFNSGSFVDSKTSDPPGDTSKGEA